MIFLKFRSALFLLTLLWSTMSCAYENTDKLKVAFMMNVSDFVSGNENNQKKVTIALLNNPFGDIPKQAVAARKAAAAKKRMGNIAKNESAKKQPITFRLIHSLEDLGGLQILYIPKTNLKNLHKILKATRKKNILTISDSLGFAEAGGMVRMYLVDRHIHFIVNLHAARESGLTINSGLLRLAFKIIEGEK